MNPNATAPDTAAQQLHLGHHYLQGGNPERAAECFQAALAHDPDNARAHAWRAVALVAMLHARPAPFLPGYSRALKTAQHAVKTEVEDALRLAPDAAFVRYLCAHALRRIGETRRAVPLLEANLALDADEESLWRELALCRMKQGQGRKAEEAARRAVECAPDGAHARAVLAWVLDTRQKKGEARQAWSETLRLNPEASDAHLALGRLMLERAEVDAAQEHLTAGLRLNPTQAQAQGHLKQARFIARTPVLREINELLGGLNRLPHRQRQLVIVLVAVLTIGARSGQAWAIGAASATFAVAVCGVIGVAVWRLVRRKGTDSRS